jgi:hypothetical protein
MMIPKNKRHRVTGNKLTQLNKQIHERDGYSCIISGCSRHVPLYEKFHHEPCGAYKEDVIYKGCCLCYICHQLREGNDAERIKRECENYLRKLYPDKWVSIYQ